MPGGTVVDVFYGDYEVIASPIEVDEVTYVAAVSEPVVTVGDGVVPVVEIAYSAATQP